MAGTSFAIVTAATVNKGGVPVWTTNPQVRGYPEVDRALFCRIVASSYTYTPTLDWARPIPSWQWKRDGVAIVGATDPVYITTSSDLGKALTCTVTLTGEYGSASATSGSTIAYRNPAGDDTDTTVSNVIQANTSTTTVNLVTAGVWKTSKTTGSMSAGSNILTVADASGFSVGNQIIVATGGESGAGAYGTTGVGGVNPTLNYANATAMNADATQATNTLCWLRDTGRVYQWSGSVWNATFSSSYDPFYYSRAMPKALVTTISNKSGNTLTLAASAVVATTNANVYFDCAAYGDSYLDGDGGATDGKRIYAPAGEYAFSTDRTFIRKLVNTYFDGDGPTQTILFSPDGCPSIELWGQYSRRCIWRNFGIKGNHKLNSWGIKFTSQTVFPTTYPRGNRHSDAQECLFYNCRAENTLDDSFVISGGTSATVSCSVRLTVPVRMYLQWAFNAADSDYYSLIDCTVDSDYMCSGMETFRSTGTNIIRFTGRNAAISTNTSGGFFIDTPTLTFEAGSQYAYDAVMSALAQNWHPDRELVSVNTNIGNTSGAGLDRATNGGTIYNMTLRMTGYLDAGAQTRAKCINVSPYYPSNSIMIKGGRVEYPVKGTERNHFAVAGGDETTVAGVRFIGFSASGDISVSGDESNGRGRAVACIGENFSVRVNQRNQTNAEYIAGGGV